MENRAIWIDADACPKAIKEHIYKIAIKMQLNVTLVANSQMFVPPNPLFKLVTVTAGDDMADHYIVSHSNPKDVAITADIPLAALLVAKGVVAINIRGEVYTEDNISERLSMRDFMKELRDSGSITGGPAPFGPKDKELFANSLNKILNQK